MAETRSSNSIDMTLKDSDITENDFRNDLSVERLISILGSPEVTEAHIKSKCAFLLLAMCSDKLRFEETLLSIFVAVQDTFKNVVEPHDHGKLN